MWKASLALWLCVATADKPEDLVDRIPGFNKSAFKVYSGFIDVAGPINGYDSLKIHYQLHTSQRNPSKDPLVIWHQGGPGGSSIVGAYLEMGYFRIGVDGPYTNDYAWNRIANMLYMESPAGSGEQYGYSQCIKAGKPVKCQWDDKTQAEAYARTLLAFAKQFPEYSNDLYLTGESYFGQYGPNIANFILNNEPYNSSLKLKGMALGNACWGGDETHVSCNGPNAAQNNVQLLFGKGLFSPKLHKEIQQTCKWPRVGPLCAVKMAQMMRQVGPFDIYNIYDNCPSTASFLERTGKDMPWLLNYLKEGMATPVATEQALIDMNGGYPWHCSSINGISKWLVRDDVRTALHLADAKPGASGFSYSSSGPASITLYPELVKKLRVLVYNGDADACVPYIGNEEWIGNLADQGVLKEAAPWTPWYTSVKSTPAGYVTKYTVPGSDKDFSFVTVRLSGHMVPEFRPDAGFQLFSNFLEPNQSSMTVV